MFLLLITSYKNKMGILGALRHPKQYMIFLQARTMKDTEENEKKYLEKLFKYRMKEKLDLDNPISFNQKIQWLKLYDRNPEYTKLVDKYEVKKYIDEKLGKGFTFPTLFVWDRFEDIDFDKLPDQFVLKCTHDSGGVVICTDKNKFNKKAAKKKLNGSLNKNYYINSREWPYKLVKPRIIAEPLMVDDSGVELKDYKFMCFNGKVKCIFTCTDRYEGSGLKVTFFDTNWEKMPFERHYPIDEKEIKKPASYNEMVSLAEMLSKDIPFVRIDFYEINKRPYFGEMTFYPGSGLEEFTPRKWDDILGNWIQLPRKRR